MAEIKMSMKEVTEAIDKRVDDIYKQAYAQGFKDGAETQRQVFETLIKFNRGGSSLVELKEAEKKLLSQQKD